MHIPHAQKHLRKCPFSCIFILIKHSLLQVYQTQCAEHLQMYRTQCAEHLQVYQTQCAEHLQVYQTQCAEHLQMYQTQCAKHLPDPVCGAHTSANCVL